MNRFVRYSSVQEMRTDWGDTGATMRLIAVNSSSNSALNRIVRYNTVQEQSTTNWSSASVAPQIKVEVASAPAAFRFTGWSLLGGVGNYCQGSTEHLAPLLFRDCQFAGGRERQTVERFPD